MATMTKTFENTEEIIIDSCDKLGIELDYDSIVCIKENFIFIEKFIIGESEAKSTLPLYHLILKDKILKENLIYILKDLFYKKNINILEEDFFFYIDKIANNKIEDLTLNDRICRLRNKLNENTNHLLNQYDLDIMFKIKKIFNNRNIIGLSNNLNFLDLDNFLKICLLIDNELIKFNNLTLKTINIQEFCVSLQNNTKTFEKLKDLLNNYNLDNISDDLFVFESELLNNNLFLTLNKKIK